MNVIKLLVVIDGIIFISLIIISTIVHCIFTYSDNGSFRCARVKVSISTEYISTRAVFVFSLVNKKNILI